MSSHYYASSQLFDSTPSQESNNSNSSRLLNSELARKMKAHNILNNNSNATSSSSHAERDDQPLLSPLSPASSDSELAPQSSVGNYSNSSSNRTQIQSLFAPFASILSCDSSNPANSCSGAPYPAITPPSTLLSSTRAYPLLNSIMNLAPLSSSSSSSFNITGGGSDQAPPPPPQQQKPVSRSSVGSNSSSAGKDAWTKPSECRSSHQAWGAGSVGVGVGGGGAPDQGPDASISESDKLTLPQPQPLSKQGSKATFDATKSHASTKPPLLSPNLIQEKYNTSTVDATKSHASTKPPMLSSNLIQEKYNTSSSAASAPGVLPRLKLEQRDPSGGSSSVTTSSDNNPAAVAASKSSTPTKKGGLKAKKILSFVNPSGGSKNVKKGGQHRRNSYSDNRDIHSTPASSYDCNYDHAQETAYEDFGVERKLVVMNTNTTTPAAPAAVEQQQQHPQSQLLGMIQQAVSQQKEHKKKKEKNEKQKNKEKQQQQQQQDNNDKQLRLPRARTFSSPGPSTSSSVSSHTWMAAFHLKKTKSSPSRKSPKRNTGSSGKSSRKASALLSEGDDHQNKQQQQQHKHKHKHKHQSRGVLRLDQAKSSRAAASPVDLDEISAGSSDDDDDDGGYYSAPTEQILRQRELNPTTKSAVAGASAGRNGLDSERVLCQLGMDIREEDYCIEGEFSSRERAKLHYHEHQMEKHRQQQQQLQQQHNHHPGRHPNKKRPNKDAKQGGGGSGKDETTKKASSNATSSGGVQNMKKLAKLKFESIIHKTHSEESGELGNEKRTSSSSKNTASKHNPVSSSTQNRSFRINANTANNNNNNNYDGTNGPSNTKVFGSKVLALLRRHRSNNNNSSSSSSLSKVPHQIITIVTSEDECNEIAITPEEMLLVKRWQTARARKVGQDSNNQLYDDSIALGDGDAAEFPIDMDDDGVESYLLGEDYLDEDDHTFESDNATYDTLMNGQRSEDVISVTANSCDQTTIMDNRRRRPRKF